MHHKQTICSPDTCMYNTYYYYYYMCRSKPSDDECMRIPREVSRSRSTYDKNLNFVTIFLILEKMINCRLFFEKQDLSADPLFVLTSKM